MEIGRERESDLWVDWVFVKEIIIYHSLRVLPSLYLSLSPSLSLSISLSINTPLSLYLSLPLSIKGCILRQATLRIDRLHTILPLMNIDTISCIPVHCILQSVCYTVYSVQCTWYSIVVSYILNILNIQDVLMVYTLVQALHRTTYTQYGVYCTSYRVHCISYSVHCTSYMYVNHRVCIRHTHTHIYIYGIQQCYTMYP